MMKGDLIHTFAEGNRKAYVYYQSNDSFRVFMYDGYLDVEQEQFCSSETVAEEVAEDWVLCRP